MLEDTGVTAYEGQAPRIKSDAVLAAALAIHTVEARHAAWIREINGASPAPHAFDKLASMKTVLAEVAHHAAQRQVPVLIDVIGEERLSTRRC